MGRKNNKNKQKYRAQMRGREDKTRKIVKRLNKEIVKKDKKKG